MLEIAGSDHDAVNILARQHLFGILVALRLEIESSLHLGCAVLPCQTPEITNSNGLNRHLFGRQLGHVDVALATVSTAKLS